MKITYLHQYFNTPDMSGATRSYEIGRRLVAAGHEVNMITSWREPRKGTDWFITTEAGMRVHWLPVAYSNHMGYRERVRAFSRFALGAGRRAASLSADVVYATSTPLTIALPAIYASRRLGVPMVFEVRDLWPDVPIALGVLRSRWLIALSLRLERLAYKNAARVITLTPTMRDFLSGKGIPLEKIAVVPNGSDLECSLSNPPSERNDVEKRDSNPRILMYCGNLGPAHGPQYLVSLAKVFMKERCSVKICVVGDGALREQLEQSARSEGCLGRTITFTGPVTKREIWAFYAKADASIMTITSCELLFRHSVQNKFFDSLAAGKPVFANYSGWASELAIQEQAGVIVPRDDVRTAARIIAERLHDRRWLSESSKAARRLAERCFSRDALAKKVEDILQAAVKSGDAAESTKAGSHWVSVSPGRQDRGATRVSSGPKE